MEHLDIASSEEVSFTLVLDSHGRGSAFYTDHGSNVGENDPEHLDPRASENSARYSASARWVGTQLVVTLDQRKTDPVILRCECWPSSNTVPGQTATDEGALAGVEWICALPKDRPFPMHYASIQGVPREGLYMLLGESHGVRVDEETHAGSRTVVTQVESGGPQVQRKKGTHRFELRVEWQENLSSTDGYNSHTAESSRVVLVFEGDGSATVEDRGQESRSHNDSWGYDDKTTSWENRWTGSHSRTGDVTTLDLRLASRTGVVQVTEAGQTRPNSPHPPTEATLRLTCTPVNLEVQADKVQGTLCTGEGQDTLGTGLPWVFVAEGCMQRTAGMSPIEYMPCESPADVGGGRRELTLADPLPELYPQLWCLAGGRPAHQREVILLQFGVFEVMDNALALVGTLEHSKVEAQVKLTPKTSSNPDDFERYVVVSVDEYATLDDARAACDALRGSDVACLARAWLMRY